MSARVRWWRRKSNYPHPLSPAGTSPKCGRKVSRLSYISCRIWGRPGGVDLNYASYQNNPKDYEHARQLRHDSTPAEGKLWAYLLGNKLHGVSFRRQHAIGQYVVDFCAVKLKLIIERAGSQHLDLEEYDNERTRSLEMRGYNVFRSWND